MNLLRIKTPLVSCIVMGVGFTWLNPHVWIDVVMVVGSSAQSYSEDARLYFILGVSLCSMLWFCLLGYGASLMRPLFQKPIAWKIINVLTGLTMLCLAFFLAI